MMSSSATPYDAVLLDAIDRAVVDICDGVLNAMPLAGAGVLAWMRELAGGDEPAAYYRHVRGSPMFLFPWYLEKMLHDVTDSDLQFDLVYSTVNGYYWVRLIDNLMDGQGTNEAALLPALGFFHTEFQRVYQKHFDAAHPFWDYFAATWFHSADVTIFDGRGGDVDRAQFVQVAAQKICAIKIPLAAVCYTYSRPDLVASWGKFVDLFGCWHQMSNDLFHWFEDFEAGTTTYFLAEALRQKGDTEVVSDWVAREGFAWGVGVLDGWMSEMQASAQALGCAELVKYLSFRDTLLQSEAAEMIETLQMALRLKSLFFDGMR